MDLKEKVTTALQRHFTPEAIVLDDNDGLVGYVVSARFRRMDDFDRQMLIHDALRDSSSELSPDELRKVEAIAALTPEEQVGYGVD